MGIPSERATFMGRGGAASKPHCSSAVSIPPLDMVVARTRVRLCDEAFVQIGPSSGRCQLPIWGSENVVIGPRSWQTSKR